MFEQIREKGVVQNGQFWDPTWNMPDVPITQYLLHFNNILFTLEIWSPGGTMREIIEVPFPRAAVKFLISFFTLNISIYRSAAAAAFASSPAAFGASAGALPGNSGPREPEVEA